MNVPSDEMSCEQFHKDNPKPNSEDVPRFAQIRLPTNVVISPTGISIINTVMTTSDADPGIPHAEASQGEAREESKKLKCELSDGWQWDLVEFCIR
jgi:hypothetical protein